MYSFGDRHHELVCPLKIILRRADCFIEGQQYTCNGRYSECCTGIWHHALVLMSHKTMPVKVISEAMASTSQLGLFFTGSSIFPGLLLG